MRPAGSPLDPIRRDPARSGLFLDFDGTLAEIVERPDLARPLPETSRHLERLAGTYGLVAIVTGRQGEEVGRLLGPTSATVFGLYGLEADGTAGPVDPELRGEVTRVVASTEGAWIEDKGPSLAVHYRQSGDPDTAERRLRPPLEALAAEHGMALLPGKMVLEIAPAFTPGKGSVVRREARERGLRACLYAGDDRADLEAFAALDALRVEGVATVKVAVRSAESPQELLRAADLSVEGPKGFAGLLAQL